MASQVKLATAVVEIGTRGFGGLNQEIGRTKGALTSALQGLAQQAAGVFGGMQFSSLVSGLGGLAKEFTATSLSLAASAETTATGFKVLLGDAAAAKTLLEDIREFAASTPFEFPELTTAGRSLLAFGVSASDVVPSLRRLGDIASGLSIPIGELSEIYGKARVSGRLFAEDINQLTGRGIPLIQELAKQFGVAESDVRKLVETGQVGFDNLERAFVDLTSEGGKFYKMTQEQSKTTAGLWSTMNDSFGLIKTSFGEALVEGLNLKEGIASITVAAEDFGKAFQAARPEIMAALNQVNDTLNEVSKSLLGTENRVESLTDALIVLAETVNAVAKAFEWAAKVSDLAYGAMVDERLQLLIKAGRMLMPDGTPGGAPVRNPAAASPALVDAAPTNEAYMKMLNDKYWGGVAPGSAPGGVPGAGSLLSFDFGKLTAGLDAFAGGLKGGARGIVRGFDAASEAVGEMAERFGMPGAGAMGGPTMPGGVFRGNAFHGALQSALLGGGPRMMEDVAKKSLDKHTKTVAVLHKILGAVERAPGFRIASE